MEVNMMKVNMILIIIVWAAAITCIVIAIKMWGWLAGLLYAVYALAICILITYYAHECYASSSVQEGYYNCNNADEECQY